MLAMGVFAGAHVKKRGWRSFREARYIMDKCDVCLTIGAKDARGGQLLGTWRWRADGVDSRDEDVAPLLWGGGGSWGPVVHP